MLSGTLSELLVQLQTGPVAADALAQRIAAASVVLLAPASRDRLQLAKRRVAARCRSSQESTWWTGSGPAISVVMSVIHETELLQSTLLLDAATLHAVSLMLEDPRATNVPEQF